MQRVLSLAQTAAINSRFTGSQRRAEKEKNSDNRDTTEHASMKAAELKHSTIPAPHIF